MHGFKIFFWSNLACLGFYFGFLPKRDFWEASSSFSFLLWVYNQLCSNVPQIFIPLLRSLPPKGHSPMPRHFCSSSVVEFTHYWSRFFYLISQIVSFIRRNFSFLSGTLGSVRSMRTAQPYLDQVVTNAVAFASTAVIDSPLACAKLVCFCCNLFFNAWR